MGAMAVPFIVAGSGPNTVTPVDRHEALAPPPNPPESFVDLDDSFGVTGYLPESVRISPDLLAPPVAQAPQVDRSMPDGPHGIPGNVLDAYRRAESTMVVSDPGCGLNWWVLAGVGRVESNHARGGRLASDGTTVRPILGPQLSGGPGVAAIRDTDGGRLDGDPVWDRAVGPMQFIPSTWVNYRSDGNGDGIATPHNMYDAALDAARYLCAGDADLRDPAQLARAIFRYNHSNDYVRIVLTWARAYSNGVTPIPSQVEGDVQLVSNPSPVQEANPSAPAAPQPPAEGCGCQPPGEQPPPLPGPPDEEPVPPPAPQPPGHPIVHLELGLLTPPVDGAEYPGLLDLGLGVHLGPLLNLDLGLGLGR
jgi:hypothetical protein